MIRFPNCKINLGLSVLEKLPDGYHRIETVFYPIPLRDILEIIPSKDGKTRLTVSGIELPAEPEENLCYKAWHLMHREHGIPPVEMHLHKQIPSGAGLGGGSADAAFTLSLLNELFGLALPKDELVRLANRLGMDCAFFLLNSPALGSNRGEVLEPLSCDLSGKFLVLVKPDVNVSTAEAYAGIQPKPATLSIREQVRQPLTDWKNSLTNDFEASVFGKYPEIHQLKEQLYSLGATYASMSGSGSSVYGIFDIETDLRAHFDVSFYWQGRL